MKKTFEEHKKLILEFMRDGLYVPMKEKELAIILQTEPEDRAELKAVLNSLLSDGSITISKRGKYSVQEVKPVVGTFISNQKGFGFVEVEGQEEDYFIPAEYTGGAFHQDTVEIALLKRSDGKRQEAKIVRIVERGMKEVVGTFQKSKTFGFVIPDNQKLDQDIFVPTERSKGAVDGHKVVVEITDYGTNGRKPEGKVIEILGHINDPGVDILSIVKAFDLPMIFPEKVLNQAERVAQEVSEADMAGRVDLRQVQMVTIDGEDAKDLDDAVSLTVENGLYHLGVHIADVTNYVQEGSALDREALKRGTSVYLVDRVIPMLPHALSNGICSLNEDVDRLALSCLMTINEKGDVIDHKLCESVIHSNRRMTYTSVQKILVDRDEAEIAKYAELVPMFEQMGELAGILRAKRRKRGSIDFDFPETKVILDKEGHPIDIKPYERNKATNLIEEFMLAANETVAEHFFWQETPFVYRTHETPDNDKIQKLVTFIQNFGLQLKAGHREDIHPKEIQKLLDSIAGTDAEAMLSRLTLRSMKQAKYSTECSGHFGLACKYYCHFTSPIRRYPDLQIHRIIKEEYRDRLNEARIAHYKGILNQVANQSSTTERKAEEAERETVKLKKAEFMEDKIGQSFEGVVSGVTSWGIYVELANTVEGLVHYSRIPGDRYYFDEARFELVGDRTGRSFALGQKVQIIVAGVDKMTRTVDFAIPDSKGEIHWKEWL